MAIVLDGNLGLTSPAAVLTTTPLAVTSGGTGVTTSTGTGAVVLGTSPTLTTPTFDSASLATISGTAPLYMCRAWVNFNGTGTVAIRASGNVSSITDNSNGNYFVNYTTALPSSAAPIINLTDDASTTRGGNVQNTNDTSNLTTSCRIITFITDTTNTIDATGVYFSVFR